MHIRLTLVKEFCTTDRWRDASANPLYLPGQVLAKPNIQKVIKVTGVVAYPSEVTCRLRVKATDAGDFEKARRNVAAGVFMSKHCKASQTTTKDRALRFVREKTASPEQYFKEAADKAAQNNRTLIYRAGGGANLGVAMKVGESYQAGAQEAGVAPRWCITECPSNWAMEANDG